MAGTYQTSGRPKSMSETISLWVSGMTCSGCVSSIEKALLRAPGVEAATVSLESGKVDVAVEPGGANQQQLIEVVERAGFGAAPAS